ncbi:hypothetical protein [Candidatus Hakubella thermalkaliphila]|uniref:hypothetical protein n=1 Tax=Candidatus Hakubella thermalkaliphila TaxID=2754717 RepID=UPI0015946B28|nr:hypothetical protein [Candidatus Hakubella thermalkaliphila]
MRRGAPRHMKIVLFSRERSVCRLERSYEFFKYGHCGLPVWYAHYAMFHMVETTLLMEGLTFSKHK